MEMTIFEKIRNILLSGAIQKNKAVKLQRERTEMIISPYMIFCENSFVNFVNNLIYVLHG